MFLFSIFSCCTKSGDQPQEDLAKSGYKKNRETTNSRLIWQPLKLISKIWQFQKKKGRNLPKSFKNLDNFTTFVLQKWQLFLEIFQKIPFTMLLGTRLIAKWQIFITKKIIEMDPLSHQCANTHHTNFAISFLAP